MSYQKCALIYCFSLKENFSLLIDVRGSAKCEGIDYGFNFYEGHYKKSRSQAHEDKFHFAWNKPELKEGMTLINTGYGFGDWLCCIKKRGEEAIGINIREGQVQICQGRGLNVIRADWKDIASDFTLRSKLYGFANAVTIWDTVEHYVTGKYLLNRSEQNKIYSLLLN